MQAGVSVAICTYNGAARLPATLEHLLAQITAPDLKWEVLLIDNASTDDSAAVCERCWPADAPAPLRVLHEPRLGLSYARERALGEARYEVVSFVDDDNWVCERWVERAAEIMAEHPEVGVCSGFSEPAAEAPLPTWFDPYKSYYAIGLSGTHPGDVTDSLSMIWGAGLTIRKAAWTGMTQCGFRLLTSAAGEDHELSFGVRLAGWRVWIDRTLEFRHYLPAHRLTWNYFRALLRGRGFMTVANDPYVWALAGSNGAGVRGSWSWNFINAARYPVQNAIRRPLKMLRRSAPALAGDHDVMRFEMQLGRLIGLWRCRKHYTANMRTIAAARRNRQGVTPIDVTSLGNED